eukprot:9237223-Pyramimonas_sp.AAC.1
MDRWPVNVQFLCALQWSRADKSAPMALEGPCGRTIAIPSSYSWGLLYVGVANLDTSSPWSAAYPM